MEIEESRRESVIEALYHRGKMSHKEIKSYLDQIPEKHYLKKSMVSVTVDNLVEEEIASKKVDPLDKRLRAINLTEKGRNYYENKIREEVLLK